MWLWKLYNNAYKNLSTSPQVSLGISISSRKNIQYTSFISAYILCQKHHRFSHSKLQQKCQTKKVTNIIYRVSCTIRSTLYKYVLLLLLLFNQPKEVCTLIIPVQWAEL